MMRLRKNSVSLIVSNWFHSKWASPLVFHQRGTNDEMKASEYQKNKFTIPGLIIVFKHPPRKSSRGGSKGQICEGSETNVSSWLFLITNYENDSRRRKDCDITGLNERPVLRLRSLILWVNVKCFKKLPKEEASHIENKLLQSSKDTERIRLCCVILRPCKSSLV